MSDEGVERPPKPAQQEAELPELGDGRYRLLRRIGRGGMGAVFEALHVALEKVVVIKILLPNFADNPGVKERVAVEARSQASLIHPNIAAVLDFGAAPDGRPFIVMERLEGCTLGDELRHRAFLPLGEALAVTRQILAGLGAAHAKGIIHRDIKPANVFLVRSGSERIAKVLDFGLAKVVHGMGDGRGPTPSKYPTAPGAMLGTPQYIAPEQVLGYAVDGRADLYSTAMALYKMVAGQGPFHGMGVDEIIIAQVKTTPAPPSAIATQPIPPELDAIILKGLAKEPADRFASAEEFDAALRQVEAALSRPRSPQAGRGTVPMRPKEPLASPDTEASTVPRAPAPTPATPAARPMTKQGTELLEVPAGGWAIPHAPVAPAPAAPIAIPPPTTPNPSPAAIELAPGRAPSRPWLPLLAIGLLFGISLAVFCTWLLGRAR